MSEMIDAAVKELNQKTGGSFDGSAKFVVEDEGTIMLDGEGARAADEDAEVTMTADSDTFREIFEGSLDPTSAFMSGRLKIDGDMGQAMKLAQTL
ncbi:SCP-2 sterol transfer family protein [Rhodobacteraceae bacterium THAF1]|uniref:SCP2 sterol-binding domain-containing protein n=1 Tax=Palleronia sp. THAF1 TaxID=2587842 RepID=UPI000F3B5F7D|nr:SCP2 sterol-binding domain-containing protein [Palleronia sp. THAF1]QFU08653.1 SCP-2 sterol transfer family protein [Palleronia sp. THAF1]VDC28399.1 SCP-2 sterol transfer family protein [Rhodobacteraceae bacterium THAF1]